ncbi:hypothetical protein G6F56_008660 [Rhizopus delemar]|nr:hypothetical protein G6F56_008660 [Rhizopus delemar]
MHITNSVLVLFSATVQVYAAATATTGHYLAQVSPTFPKMKSATGVVSSYNAGPYDTSSSLSTAQLKGYPEPWSSPDVTHAEVKAAYKKINWSKVPKAPIRKQNAKGEWIFKSDGTDPYCWWSDTTCRQPKVSYLPPDIFECPKKGDWGLTYDDGPFNKLDADDENAAKENPYAEPILYNFLAKRNLHANLFYIGSNVVTYPAAAKRALNNGHQLCVHTWSHPVMTTQSNIKVVAELYWTLKAIKEATGVTPKCWRPPQGDVDDRVRSIAWQMGLRTILWNQDSNDWNMPDPMNGGNLPSKTVDGYFQKWINDQKAGKLNKGLVVLEHELNRMTVNMTMHWLPALEKTFNVVPALSCNGITEPYWETKFVYPTGSSSRTTTTTSKTSKPTATNKGLSCDSKSYGLGNGNGYNGCCCKTQMDCIEDCIRGTCNGPTDPNTTTKKVSKTTTKKSSSPTTASCLPGSRGKKKGNGKDGYCCSSSDDCLETCRNGKCGL